MTMMMMMTILVVVTLNKDDSTSSRRRCSWSDTPFSRGEVVPLFKCPFCSFKNIHEEEITHHIRYKEDTEHDVDVDAIDKKRYIITTKKTSHYHYERKEDYPLPWLKCLWCNYRDKIERDLEWHFIEMHRRRLDAVKVLPDERKKDPIWTRDSFSWMYSDLEYRIYKVMKLVRKKNAATKQENN